MKRLISLVLLLTMVFLSIFGIIPSASETGSELKITKASLEFGSTVYLMIGVDYSSVTGKNPEDIKITVTGNELDSTGAPFKTELTEDADTTAYLRENGFVNYVGFKYKGLGAKNLGDVLTIQAYIGDEASGEPITYSVIEYVAANAPLAESKAPYDIAFYQLLCSMLYFGGVAQKTFEYTGNYPLIDENGQVIDYGVVKVSGADAGSKKIIARVGEQFNVVPDSNVFKLFAPKPADAEKSYYSVLGKSAKNLNTYAIDPWYNLYDMDFNQVSSENITVTGTPVKLAIQKGVKRYFFYGTDLWGIPGSYNTTWSSVKPTDESNFTSPNSAANLDFDVITNNQKLLGTGKITENNGSLFGDRYLREGLKASSPISTSKVNYGNTSASSMRTWQLRWTDYETSATDGRREVGPGYLYIDCSDNPDTKNITASTCRFGTDSSWGNIKNYVNDGKFSFVISLAKKAGVPFTDSPSVLKGTNSDIDFFSVLGTAVNVFGVPVAKLNEFDTEAPSADDFTEIYCIFDFDNNKITVYNDVGGRTVISLFGVGVVDLSDFYVNSASIQFEWNILANSGTAYINRVTYASGAIIFE